LRGIGLINLDCARCLIVKLLADPGIRRLADHLGPDAMRLLGGVIEGLADVTGGSREGSGNLARRFVDEVLHLTTVPG
jgi:hypothetical protein